MSLPGGFDGKESTGNAGDLGSIPGLERFPGEGNGNLLQYSCLENTMDRRAWWAVVPGVEIESNTTGKLSTNMEQQHKYEQSAMTRPGADYGSDQELLTEKFRL